MAEGQVLTLGLEDTFPSLLPPPWSLFSSYCGQAATGTDGQGDVPPPSHSQPLGLELLRVAVALGEVLSLCPFA